MPALFPRPLLPILAAALASGSLSAAADDPITLNSGKHRIAFHPRDGSIAQLLPAGSARTLFHSGDQGLWQIRFADGKLLSASEFQAGGSPRSFAATSANGSLLLAYAAPEIRVELRVTAHETGFDFQSRIVPAAKTVLEFAFPAKLRFAPERLERFVAPVHPQLGIGAAFNRRFFEAQPYDRPSGWAGKPGGPAGYRRLFGADLDMRDLKEPAVQLEVTAQGREWLGSHLAARLGGATARVSRPSRRAQLDLALVDSPHGPFFGASRLAGNSGALWRFGGQLDDREQELAVAAVEAVLRKLAAAPGERRRLAFPNLVNGPAHGPGANASTAGWRQALERLAGSLRLEWNELRTAEAMMDALAQGETLAILNPYGEWLPVPEKADLGGVVDAIGRFVRAGGHWFEVGGYPFYAAMRPSRHLAYGSPYPPVFSDFLHLDAVDGQASLYRIQPRTWQPWSGAGNAEHIFVPGRLAFAGDEQGGWCERAFGAFVAPGQTWTAPVVRFSLGRSAEDEIPAYCQANAISRSLSEKLPPALLNTFRQAVLVKFRGSAREKLAALDRLPVPSLIHDSEYLKGGFDKEYPDHLPPNPRFGSPGELRQLHDRAHALGHLVMPYTNPTWWCDHPRGPSFQEAGEAPLLRNLDGSLSHEQYASNDGWTTCFWHPAVRAANRRTLHGFTRDYPVDLLFQDQCGARGWRYDRNPASPGPLAYVEGLLSMVDEDSRTKPLSTEDGWDQVLNAEAQLCGFTFGLGAGQRPAWAREMKTVYHPATWELYPFLQRVAHDKAALLHHDLGKFVTDRPTLSWTLGLGFCMSYAVSASALGETRPREWLRWLDRLQKSVCSRYLGEPVTAFEHRQGSEAPGDDGTLHAGYGPVTLLCNLSPRPLGEAGRELAPHGFLASAPGMLAGNLRSLGGTGFGEDGISFVSEGDGKHAEVWIYAAPGEEAAAELPGAAPRSGEMRLMLDGQAEAPVQVREGVIRFRLPSASHAGTQAKVLWHATLHAP